MEKHGSRKTGHVYIQTLQAQVHAFSAVILKILDFQAVITGAQFNPDLLAAASGTVQVPK